MSLRYPIVLVHGLYGFDQIHLDLGRHNLLRVDYFREAPASLSALGVPAVHAAALPPHGTIAARAAALAAFIETAVTAPRFHLVAHSMGGLDARHYLTHLGGADRGAASLTTLGTPHCGSPLATLAVESLFEPCFRLARRLRLGRALRLGLEQTAAHRDLRPDACAAFNAATPDVPGVAYFSWAGDPPRSAVQWPLRLAWHLLRRCEGGGPNDGLVTVDSARWTGWRGALPADHLSLCGWQLTAAARRRFAPAAFFAALLADLSRAE